MMFIEKERNFLLDLFGMRREFFWWENLVQIDHLLCGKRYDLRTDVPGKSFRAERATKCKQKVELMNCGPVISTSFELKRYLSII